MAPGPQTNRSISCAAPSRSRRLAEGSVHPARPPALRSHARLPHSPPPEPAPQGVAFSRQVVLPRQAREGIRNATLSASERASFLRTLSIGTGSPSFVKERLWPTEPSYIQWERLPAFSRWLRGGHELVLLGTTLGSFRRCHGNPGQSWRSERFIQPRDGYPHRRNLHIRVVVCTPYSSPADCKSRQTHIALPD